MPVLEKSLETISMAGRTAIKDSDKIERVFSVIIQGLLSFFLAVVFSIYELLLLFPECFQMLLYLVVTFLINTFSNNHVKTTLYD